MSESSAVSMSNSLTWKQLIPRLIDTENCLQFCWEYGLLPDHAARNCVDCSSEKSVTLYKRKAFVHFPFQITCKKCRKRSSITKNTWFDGKKLGIDQNIIIVACWIRNCTLEETASECQLSVNTVSEYYGFCREVCYVIVTNDSAPIGGENKIVEVHEAHIATRKFGRVRNLNERERIWVFGGIERESKKCFIVRVYGRGKDTLVPLIKHFILPGTKVVTDGWKSYKTLKDEGFDHEFVNHSVHFLSSEDPSADAQNTERLWKSLKSSIKKEGRPGDRDEFYIFQYLYFHNLKVSGKSLPCETLPVFLKDVSKVYPGYGKRGMVPVAYNTNGIVHDKEMPVHDKEMPVHDKEIPTNNKEIPTNNKEIPTNNKEIPMNEKEMPMNDKEMPINDEEMPLNDEEMPLNDKEMPLNDKEIPVHEKEVPDP